MTESQGQSGVPARSPYATSALAGHGAPPASLADVLERVLDKGIVVAGDIQVRLLNIELLTVKIRLLIASVERAREMGINWWESDAFVSSGASAQELGDSTEPDSQGALRQRVDALETRLRELQQAGSNEQDGDER